jgi:hypothetical protein
VYVCVREREREKELLVYEAALRALRYEQDVKNHKQISVSPCLLLTSLAQYIDCRESRVNVCVCVKCVCVCARVFLCVCVFVCKRRGNE